MRSVNRIAVLLVASLLLSAAPDCRAEPLNRIVLRVNDRIATLLDYRQRLGQGLAEINQRNLPPERREQVLEQLPERVFRDLFEELLVLSSADQQNLEISDSELQGSIDQLREANGFATREELARAVAQSGQTWSAFEGELEKNLRIRQSLGRALQERIQIEEDDLRLFYRDNPEMFEVPAQRRLREIVVLDSSDLSPDERRQLAESLHSRLTAGAEPAELVAELAVQGKTSNVIELGWVATGDLDEALSTAVDELAVDSWSDPVEARGGLHLVQLLEEQEAFVRPFDTVKEEIYQREYNRLYQREMPGLLRELEERSYIVANPPPEAAGFRSVYEQMDAPLDPVEKLRRQLAKEDEAES